jgi:RimJ/RimL family protein N-acetyltransferase
MVAAEPAPEPVPLRLAQASTAAPVEVHPGGTIRTARMVLRALREGDRDEYLRVLRHSRPHLDRWFPLHHEGDTDERVFDRQLRLTRQAEVTGRAFRRIGVLDDGRIAGAFNIGAISRGLEFSGEVNWWIAVDQTRRGLATEGVDALLTFALADIPLGLGLSSVGAWIMRDNGASVQVAQKVGLVRAGDERAYLQMAERWQMHDLYVRRPQGLAAAG